MRATSRALHGITNACTTSKKELGLNLRIKPRKRLVREKKQDLMVPQGFNQVWPMDFMHDQLEYGRSFRLFNVTTTTTEKPSAWRRKAIGMEAYFSLASQRAIRELR